jgi:thiol-disulfide isomerase/thioredoxin
MKRLFALIVFALAISPAAVWAQGNHEYSPLVEKTVNYKNWTLNDLKDNKPVDLRSLVAGKKLVMVVYFAPWCPNWHNEAPVAAKLYEKYKDQGFGVIGVSEYGMRDAVANFFGPTGPPYPVVS